VTTQGQETIILGIKRAVLGVGGIIIACLGIWCFPLAMRAGVSVVYPGVSVNTRVLALVSFLAESVFCLLLCFSGMFSIRSVGRVRSGSVGLLLRPSLPKLIILIILVALSVLALTERVPTTKVTWRESRGIPLTFLILTEYRGPCWPEADFCTYRFLEALYPSPLIVVVLVSYYSACLFHSALQKVRRRLTLAAPDWASGVDFDCSAPETVTNGDCHTPDPPSR